MTILCALLALLVANLVIANLVITITSLYSYSSNSENTIFEENVSVTDLEIYFLEIDMTILNGLRVLYQCVRHWR